MEFIQFSSLEEALKEKLITMKTYERVKIAKSYIEKKYKIKKADEDMKKKEWEEIYKKLESYNLSKEESEKFKEILLKHEAKNIREDRQKTSIYQFESLSIIGRGAFGEVRVCKDKETNEIVAVKKMRKDEMHKKNQVLHVKAEQEVLAKAESEWIVSLKYSFQDDEYLYLVMDFLPGGDLMSLLMANDILPEEQAKLYAAEMVLAIGDIHKLHCIHRDIKPDNVLIGIDGHIKLSDFGLSRQADSNLYEENPYDLKNAYSFIPGISNIAAKYADQFNNRKRKRIFAFSTVGTPDYIAPEVFSQTGYGPEVDWWSLGVILFEMLVGYPPFFSDSPTETCKKIMNWKQYLKFPPESKISPESKDIIRKLITDVDKRIGFTGSDEIKNHPFFSNIDWNNIKKHRPIFVPKVENSYDTKYFEKFDEEEIFYPKKEETAKQISKDICFIDFDFERGYQKKSLLALLNNDDFIKTNLNNIKTEMVSTNAFSNQEINIPGLPCKTPKEKKNIYFSKFLSKYDSNMTRSNNNANANNTNNSQSNNNNSHSNSNNQSAIMGNSHNNINNNTQVLISSNSKKIISSNNISNSNSNMSIKAKINSATPMIPISHNKRNTTQISIPKTPSNQINFSSMFSNNHNMNSTQVVNNSNNTNNNANTNITSNISNLNTASKAKNQISTLKSKLQLKLNDLDEPNYDNFNNESKIKTATHAYISKNKGSLTLKKDTNGNINYNIPSTTTNKQVIKLNSYSNLGNRTTTNKNLSQLGNISNNNNNNNIPSNHNTHITNNIQTHNNLINNNHSNSNLINSNNEDNKIYSIFSKGLNKSNTHSTNPSSINKAINHVNSISNASGSVYPSNKSAFNKLSFTTKHSKLVSSSAINKDKIKIDKFSNLNINERYNKTTHFYSNNNANSANNTSTANNMNNTNTMNNMNNNNNLGFNANHKDTIFTKKSTSSIQPIVPTVKSSSSLYVAPKTVKQGSRAKDIFKY